jgi:hypothetical protein
MFSKILLSFGDAICIANLRHSSACFLYSPTRRMPPYSKSVARCPFATEHCSKSAKSIHYAALVGLAGGAVRIGGPPSIQEAAVSQTCASCT